MPSSPVIMHQNTAPGPPLAIATATPTILPVPTLPARETAREAYCDMLRPSDRRLNEYTSPRSR